MRVVSNKKNKIKKYTLLLILPLTLILVSSIFALNYFNIEPMSGSKEDTPENIIDYKKPIKEQEQEGENIKDEFDKIHYNENNVEESNGNTTAVNITYISQENNTISLRTIIKSLDQGVCKIRIVRGNSILYESEADTIVQGSYSTCKGFDVDSSSLPSGDSTFIVEYKNESHSGGAQKGFNINAN